MAIYKVKNPDHLELEFEVAGIGSRIGAAMVDGACMTLIALFGLLIVGLLTTGIETLFCAIATSAEDVLLILGAFVLQWGYHVVFEITSQGQSPGKKLCGIQVITDEGLFPTWKHAMLRNLVRIVDSFPGMFYLVGGVAMKISGTGKRLGDLLAGTLVVSKREYFTKDSIAFSAFALMQIEQGKRQHALKLPCGFVDLKTIIVIRRFFMRRHRLSEEIRAGVSKKLASPLYEKWGKEIDDPEAFLEMILEQAEEQASNEKIKEWKKFEKEISDFGEELSSDEIEHLLASYRQIVADASRVQSKYLNCLAVKGHQFFYRNLHERRERLSFSQEVARHLGPVMLSFALFFLPAFISYGAVLTYPEVGYDLVPDSFIDFSPAEVGNMHEIPSIARPLATSEIMTNNIQVSFDAFALGLTAGLGTCYVLVFNGVHIGSLTAWFQLNGDAYAFWGWVLPHGPTEILAIILSGAAGLILADAILRPGSLGRREALKKAGKSAVIIMLGVVGMLVIAGLIEGFVSPSSIGYSSRVAIAVGSSLFWLVYFARGAR